jgi:hypothetical protein
MSDFVSDPVKEDLVAKDLDPEQTPEERIEWLRSKGILIEIPGERKAKPKAATDVRKVKVVRIPCDEKEPMQELDIEIDNTRFGDQLLEQLRPFVLAKSTGEFDMEVMKQTAAKQFGSADINITEDLLRSLQDQGGVETFTLDQPCEDNNHMGVALYLDEASQLKCLPANRRASQIAQQCGFLNVPLAGDVFLGRTSLTRGGGPEGGKVTNANFRLPDVDSGGLWMRGAESRNYAAKAAAGQIDMSGDSLPKVTNSSGDVWDTQGLKWTETATTMEVVFSLGAWAKLPSLDGKPKIALTPAEFKKQCKVTFAHKSVRIINRDSGTTLLDLNLHKGVETDDCTYTLTAGPDGGACEVEISLEKAARGLWGKLV